MSVQNSVFPLHLNMPGLYSARDREAGRFVQKKLTEEGGVKKKIFYFL